MSNQVKFRVLRLSKEQKDHLRTTRERRGENNLTVIANAVKNALPGILKALQALGFGVSGGKKSPARLPFAEETLSGLRRASKASGVPTTVLFSLCLRNAKESKGKAVRAKGAK